MNEKQRRICTARQSDPDFGRLIPVSIMMRYISPVGKVKHRENLIDGKLTMADIQQLINEIEDNEDTPMDQVVADHYVS